MFLRITRFTALLFMALVLGIGSASLIGSDARIDVLGTVFLTVQQVVYQDLEKVLNLVELVSFIAVLLALVRVVRRKPFFIMTLLSCICVAVVIGMRFLSIRPLQQAIASWSVESIPETWMSVRNRYYLFAMIRTGFSILAFCSLSLSVLFDTPQYRVESKVS
jgi:hypothetical protein